MHLAEVFHSVELPLSADHIPAVPEQSQGEIRSGCNPSGDRQSPGVLLGYRLKAGQARSSGLTTNGLELSRLKLVARLTI